MRGILDRLLGNKRLLNILGGVVVFGFFAACGYAVLRAGVAPWAAFWCFWPVCALAVIAALLSDFWREDRVSELPYGLRLIVKAYNAVAGALIGSLLAYALAIILVPVVAVLGLFKSPGNDKNA